MGSLNFNVEEYRRALGRKIKQFREEAELTQQQLADRAGITRANVNRIEGGSYSTGQDILSKVAQALGKKLDIV